MAGEQKPQPILINRQIVRTKGRKPKIWYILKCNNCAKFFKRGKQQKFCSLSCSSSYRNKHRTGIKHPFFGKKLSESHKQKISSSNLGKYRKRWDDIGYHQKHIRMKRAKPKPDKCDVCGMPYVKLNMVNIDHKYSENSDDWIWACYSCHKRKDIKLEQGAK